MPGSATITSSDLIAFTTTSGVIRSAHVNGNFSVWRGHNLPVSVNTSTAATSGTYDLGASDHRWRYSYGSPIANVVSTTGAYSLAVTDDAFIASPAGGTITVTLPAVATVPTGKMYLIKKTDAGANEIKIICSGAEKVDNTTTVGLFSAYEGISLITNGTGWHSI